jgi:hypothetical protein
MTNSDIILVANSPGELSAMVKPAAEALADKELEYIRTIRGIAQSVSAEDYKNWILLKRDPGIKFNARGVVLYLGGDLAHAMLVAKKVKYPALAYVQDRIGWTRFYKKFLVPDEACRKKLGRGSIVGNLMVDSVSDIPQWCPQKNVITFLPGSRAWQINHTTPIYAKIIEYIRSAVPEVRFQVVSSPFVKALEIPGTAVVNFEDAHNSELAITIPGTNTARLAAMGIPMISLFPLDDPDVIPLEGLMHYITSIPGIGSVIKKALVNALNKKIKFFALPNIKADKEIVPEIRGVIDPSAAALKAIDLLKNKKERERMSKELIQAMGKPGANLKIVEAINETLRQTA